ncbi:MAG TPA: RdgB/HAM1 family non-canonical purine NTP pyrophosphatase [Cyclobacteriaceae bacterium]|nr:RdgB/HAM1 family non-canonical purine NTP pyrophosphatase [Cyclobacteriaceae bacterium]
MTLCFATNNVHKLNEISKMLNSGIKILSLEEIGCRAEIPENFNTIEENSRAKAAYIYDLYRIDCFADDTGIEVHALGGEPGVKSARFAGPDQNSMNNINLLLEKLGSRTDRDARFRTVITLILKGTIRQFEGAIEGSITFTPRGESGFGYDPVFLPSGQDLTFAEMDPEQKNRISHRARAVEKLIGYLNDLEANSRGT